MDRLEICMTVFLGINTWTDIRKKEIYVPVLSVFLAGGILWRIWEGTFWADGLISMGAGTIAAVISVLTRGEIGFGDGLLILAMGSVLKSGELLGVLCAALLLCGIYSGLQLLVFKKKRDTEIPFAPFLLVGYLGGILL